MNKDWYRLPGSNGGPLVPQTSALTSWAKAAYFSTIFSTSTFLLINWGGALQTISMSSWFEFITSCCLFNFLVKFRFSFLDCSPCLLSLLISLSSWTIFSTVTILSTGTSTLFSTILSTGTSNLFSTIFSTILSIGTSTLFSTILSTSTLFSTILSTGTSILLSTILSIYTG